MEEEPDASESDADQSASSPGPSPARNARFRPASRPRPAPFLAVCMGLSTFLALSAMIAPTIVRADDSLGRIRRSGRLVYGSDMEGGAPYAYPEPSATGGVAGFEVELMRRLASEMGVRAELSQGQWDELLEILNIGRVDAVINGYEWSERRAREYLATRPYFVYQLQLMVRRGSSIRRWSDLKEPRPGGGPWTVGVLASSAGDHFAAEQGGDRVRVVRFDGATDAMLAVQNGQYDATLQDMPAARYYAGRYSELELVGPPEGRGYYVIFARKGEQSLRDALDLGLGKLIASGELRRLYDRYGIWNEAQEELSGFDGPIPVESGGLGSRGWGLLREYARPLLQAALVTLVLSVTSMPIAMAIGLMVAIGRLYGPRPLKGLLTGYVEILRGTPLMLQLFVLFYLLKLSPWVAGIAGLAINYSAYEAEIYRAGLQAIPAGQMEAALALGMSKRMALRRVIVPQAVRIVIPPVTNDFIALFKDTSVCSVITLVELTKQYKMLALSTGGTIEFALAASALYLLMSVPLSWFSRWSEDRLAKAGVKGAAPG